MANVEHLDLLKSGVERWNAWRKENADVRPDLGQADLSGASLYYAALSATNLIGTNLSRAQLFHANLSDANLTDANLSGASLIGADLYHANLSAGDCRRPFRNRIRCCPYSWGEVHTAAATSASPC